MLVIHEVPNSCLSLLDKQKRLLVRPEAWEATDSPLPAYVEKWRKKGRRVISMGPVEGLEPDVIIGLKGEPAFWAVVQGETAQDFSRSWDLASRGKGVDALVVTGAHGWPDRLELLAARRRLGRHTQKPVHLMDAGWAELRGILAEKWVASTNTHLATMAALAGADLSTTAMAEVEYMDPETFAALKLTPKQRKLAAKNMATIDGWMG